MHARTDRVARVKVDALISGIENKLERRTPGKLELGSDVAVDIVIRRNPRNDVGLDARNAPLEQPSRFAV